MTKYIKVEDLKNYLENHLSTYRWAGIDKQIMDLPTYSFPSKEEEVNGAEEQTKLEKPADYTLKVKLRNVINDLVVYPALSIVDMIKSSEKELESLDRIMGTGRISIQVPWWKGKEVLIKVWVK